MTTPWIIHTVDRCDDLATHEPRTKTKMESQRKPKRPEKETRREVRGSPEPESQSPARAR